MILGDSLAFLIQLPADFYDTPGNEMTNADKIINPLHLGSDPADIRLRLPINPDSNPESRITFG